MVKYVVVVCLVELWGEHWCIRIRVVDMIASFSQWAVVYGNVGVRRAILLGVMEFRGGSGWSLWGGLEHKALLRSMSRWEGYRNGWVAMYVGG